MEVKLKPDGTAEVNGTSLVAGVQAPEYRRSYQAAATRKARFEQAWAGVFPGLSVSKLSLAELKLDDAVKLEYGMAVPRYAEVLPNGLRFFTFGSGRSYAQVFAPLAERRYDLVMSNPWVSRMSVRYTLPEGHAIGALPPAIDDDTPFGRLTLSCRAEGDTTVVCDSEVTLKVARVKAADYPSFRAFLGRVDQAFSRKLTVLLSR
jgi:cellulose synthase operon protein C